MMHSLIIHDRNICVNCLVRSSNVYKGRTEPLSIQNIKPKQHS